MYARWNEKVGGEGERERRRRWRDLVSYSMMVKGWVARKEEFLISSPDLLSTPPLLFSVPGEICGFRIHGSGVPFEAVILDKATGEGLIRAKEPVDCEAHKEHTFTIQAYDCGEGPEGTNTKKSHK